MYRSSNNNFSTGYTSLSNITTSGGGGSGVPAGSDTQIQFNDSGVFGGDADFAWDKTINQLYINGRILITGNIYDATNTASIEVNNRILTNPLLQGTLNWETSQLLSNGNVSVDWSGFILWDSGAASQSIDWGQRIAYNDTGGQVIQWNYSFLNDSSTNLSIDWSNRWLYGLTGSAISMQWTDSDIVLPPLSGSSVDGALWTDSTQKCLTTYQNDLKQFDTRSLFIQTATGTIANSTVETSISSTGIGTLVLPANFFVIGKTLRIIARGFHSSAASPNITIKIKFGSTVMLTTGAVASANDTNAGFEILGNITCRTTGVSGTVFSQGSYQEMGATPKVFQMVNTATTTISTTSSQTITITAQWGTASASNTISLTNLTIEVLG